MTTYVLSPAIKFGIAGSVSSTVTYYDSGGSVTASTWSDAGTTPNASSVVLDANGTAQVYIQAGKAYRAVYRNSAGSTVHDVDPVAVADPAAGSTGGTTVTDLTVTNNLTVENDLTVEGDTTLSGDLTVGGDVTITGDTISNGIKLTSLGAGFRNGTIDADVSANAIRIYFKTQDGENPTTSTPVTITRRHHNIDGVGTFNVNFTALVSTTIPSGATLGCGASEAVRIHIGAVRNAGSSLELAAWTAAVSSSASIARYDPTAFVTTSSWSATSDSAQTIYSTSTRTSQPLVYLGYIEATSTSTAGVWSTVDKKVNWEPGVPFPGDTVNYWITETGEFSSGTNTIATDDSIMQNTEGDQYMTRAVTFKSTINRYLALVKGQFTHSVDTASVISGLFVNATANAVSMSAGTAPQNAGDAPSTIRNFGMTANTSSFALRAAGNLAGTVSFNGAAGARIFGGRCNSFLEIMEIHA